MEIQRGFICIGFWWNIVHLRVHTIAWFECELLDYRDGNKAFFFRFELFTTNALSHCLFLASAIENHFMITNCTTLSPKPQRSYTVIYVQNCTCVCFRYHILKSRRCFAFQNIIIYSFTPFPGPFPTTQCKILRILLFQCSQHNVDLHIRNLSRFRLTTLFHTYNDSKYHTFIPLSAFHKHLNQVQGLRLCNYSI